MQLLQALVDGLLIGGVYGVISIGLSLVFGVMNIINFAHAAFLMLGMFTAWFTWSLLGIDPILGAFIAFAVVFVFGCGVQQALIRPILKAPQVAQIFLTVGILIVLENGALMVFGPESRSVSTAYQTEALKFSGIIVSKAYLYAFLMALLSGSAVWLFLERTSIGRAMRATSQDPMAATLSGINTSRMHMLAFGLGVGLTGFGGAVILPYLTVSPTVGGNYIVLMFTAVVLGGLGSVAGAVLGGVAVGVIQSISTLVFPIQLQNLILFIVFILVLALRPEGLIRRKTI